MTFGSVPFSESVLAGTAFVPAVVEDPGPGTPIGGEPEVPLVIDPFQVNISGYTIKPLIDSLSIDLEYGRPGTASFTLVNVFDRDIKIGEEVLIFFYDDQIFSGFIDNYRLLTNNTETFKTIEVECVDYSCLMSRKKIKQTFTNKTPWEIANSCNIDYMGGDGITMGDAPAALAHSLPTVEAENVSIYDVIYEAAASLGCGFTINHDKVINFHDPTTLPPAPMVIDENIVMECDVVFDRETYRNYQVVEVTGTPAASEEAVTVSYTATNGDQIAYQAGIESTNGAVIERESITHPTSNVPGELLKLATAHARILLAANGEIRQTMTAKTRQYGFQVGQIADVSIPHLGRTGQWFIRSLSMQEVSGRWIESTMTLTVSSARERRQQVWIDVARKGKVTIIPPTPTLTQSTTYTTPGSYSFTVPVGIFTIQVTCRGAGGGGGGSARHTYFARNPRYSIGGKGGNGGQGIAVINVQPGQVYTITVPSGGTGGTSQAKANTTANATGATGGTGGDAQVTRSGAFYCIGYGGQGGYGAIANASNNISGIWPPAPDSGGSGNFITVGGGHIGGVGGSANPLENSHPGQSGSVKVEW